MTHALRSISEWRDVDVATFRNEILPQNRPAVLRGAVRNWPAVQAGLESPQAFRHYITRLDRRQTIELLVGPPSIDGRFFYQEGMRGLNFDREVSQIGAAIDRMIAQIGKPDASALYIQAAPVSEHLPEFGRENALELVDATATPRIWIGSPVTIPAHYDLAYNVACVVAGRRRITLFPPDQLPNLYIGPIDFSPAGTPISMVSLDEPDLARYPRFEAALAVAQQAVLEPGDAVYIPYFWWHSVSSIEPFNVLVNYWWSDAKPWVGSPYDCLLHAVMAFRDLPTDQRAAWRNMFDYFVFGTADEALAHLPPEHRGALGPLTPERARHLRIMLARSLAR